MKVSALQLNNYIGDKKASFTAAEKLISEAASQMHGVFGKLTPLIYFVCVVALQCFYQMERSSDETWKMRESLQLT